MDRLPFDLHSHHLPPLKRTKYPENTSLHQPLMSYSRELFTREYPQPVPSPPTITTPQLPLQSLHSAHHSSSAQSGNGAKGNELESDEDERFLRLAREALVATAGNNDPGHIIDPTIQDLLQRLQYALTPHGNPIKRSEEPPQPAFGMPLGFYDHFPNLSNDIFTGASYPQPATVAPPPVAQLPPLSNDYDAYDEERKFQCPKCSQGFRRLLDLKRHEKQHLVQPPNICDLCGKGFARKDALKRHRDTQTCRRNLEKKLYLDNLAYI